MGNPAPPQPRANERTWILNSIHTWTCSRLVRSFVHSSIPRVHSFVPSFTRSLIHSKLFIISVAPCQTHCQSLKVADTVPTNHPRLRSELPGRKVVRELPLGETVLCSTQGEHQTL